MLIRLLYASRAKSPIDKCAIESILTKSRVNNPELGVTGILCYGGDIYMQVLEGGRDAVNQLYNVIVRDPRHDNVMMLHYEEVSERRFAGWTMGQVNLEKLNPTTLLKYSEKPVLNPFAISGKVSMALLEELILTASIIGRADTARTPPLQTAA
ncbi:MAG: BLUF domain-containing protein [Burkholderiaceae bacterium]